MQLTQSQIATFQEKIWAYFAQNARVMPWRQDTSPYMVVVSEMMLQQTQVARVMPKFQQFMEQFPTLQVLATSSLSDVLKMWNGLGYNRRAKFLWQLARICAKEFGGQLPNTQQELVSLPGIGPNTAGAVRAYAFEQPAVFIETNIRTVFVHHFFADSLEQVDDKQLRELVSQTLDTSRPREWYWALMDYGAYLKSQTGGYLARSKHYTKQSRFEGSYRQMRGAIMKELSQGPITVVALRAKYNNDNRFDPALQSLIKEQLVSQSNHNLRLTDH